MTRSWLMHSANISSKSWYIFLQYNLSHCDPMQVKLSTYDRHFCWYRSISLHNRAVNTNSSATVIPSGANTLNSKWLLPAITAVTISKSSLKTWYPLHVALFLRLELKTYMVTKIRWILGQNKQMPPVVNNEDHLEQRNVLPAPQLKDFLLTISHCTFDVK